MPYLNFPPILPFMDDRIRLKHDGFPLVLEQKMPCRAHQRHREWTRNIVTQLLDPQNDLAKQVTELTICFAVPREYDASPPEMDGGYQVLPDLLTSVALDSILQRAENLRSFRWLVNQKLPSTILARLQTSFPAIELTIVKRELTQSAMEPPKLDLNLFNSCPLAQVHLHKTDFGCIVLRSKVPRFLRLHLSIPRVQLDSTDLEDWIEKKVAIGLSALTTTSSMEQLYLTDFHGQLHAFLPGILHHAPTLRSLKMHTLPYSRQKDRKSSIFTIEQAKILASLGALEHLEMDLSFNTTNNPMHTPFTDPLPVVSVIAQLPSLRTVRFWVEVPLERSIFQESYPQPPRPSQPPPPLHETRMQHAVSNLYQLLKAANPATKLERLEVAFTRLDTWDRHSDYPRYRLVTLRPNLVPSKGKADPGFSMLVGEWQDDWPTADVHEFIKEHFVVLH